MGMFDKAQKGDIDSLEQEIRILATNVEVLNQKLIQDPNAAVSPGEALIKKQTEQALEILGRVEAGLRNVHGETSAQASQYLIQIKTTFDNILKQMNTLPKEKQALSEEIGKLDKATSNLEKIEKGWLNDFLERIEIFNKNAIQLNNNLISYHKGMIETIDKKFDEISAATTSKLTKNLIWLIIVIIFLSIIFALLFNFIGDRFFG